MQNARAITTIVALIMAAASTRLLPHPPNFTAVTAMCLFGGAYFHRRWLAFAVPLAALLVSDIVLTKFVYHASLSEAFGSVWGNYVAFGLIVLLGMLLHNRVTLSRTAGATILATALFFLLTNFKVWAMGHGNLYPHTPSGLLACYVAALPFAINDLLGNAFYVSILFGSMELLKRRWPSLVEQPAAVPVRA